MLVAPMALNGQEAVGSMGTDTPLAVLSDHAPLLFNYFKQLFAQVTNPPVDPIREELVMSAETTIGARAESVRGEPAALPAVAAEAADPDQRRDGENQAAGDARPAQHHAVRRFTVRTTARPACARRWTNCARARRKAIADGYTIIILSDRGVDADHMAIPVAARDRRRASSSDPRRHAHAGGAGGRVGRAARGDAFLPADGLRRGRVQSVPGVRHAGRDDPRRHACKGVTEEEASHNFVKAVTKGLIKVASKMGISTLQSYRGAQIFEAIGLNREVIDRYFTWTAVARRAASVSM